MEIEITREKNYERKSEKVERLKKIENFKN